MKSKYKTIIFLVILVALLTIILGFPEFLEYTFGSPYLLKIYPTDSEVSYVVLFNQGALQGSSDYLGVVDGNGEDPNLIILGPVRFADIPLYFQRIIISLDKTVIAAESSYRADNKSIPFWLAYDFSNSTSYGAGRKMYNETPDKINARNQAILALIESRGGIGKELTQPNIYTKNNKLSWLSWKRWQSRVIPAMEQCQQWIP